MKSKISLLCACLLLASCDNSGSGDGKHQGQKAQVSVVTLKTQPITISAQLPGRISAIRTAEVRPQVSGIILKRLFKEGSDVKVGQQLYQIDPATYEADYEKTKAQLVKAQSVLNRDRTLIKANAISKESFDSAVSDYEQAKADTKTAEINLDYTMVRAPISGRIGRSSASEGALVSNGQSNALATITQLDPIYVDVIQSSSNLLKLRRALESGQLQKASSHEAAVTLTLEDGSQYSQTGRLEFSEVQVDEGTGTVTLRAQFPNQHGELLPGMFVHANVQQGVAAEGLMIPQMAVMRTNKGTPYVYTVGADSKIQQVGIKTGAMRNGQWLVSEGLKANDRVVVDGQIKVATGVEVDAVEVQKATKSAPTSAISLSTTDASAQ